MPAQDGHTHRSDARTGVGHDVPLPSVVSFGEFRIDCIRRRLLHDGRRIRIQQKPLDVLIYLAVNYPRVVSRQELLDRFWFRTVNEEALTRCVSTLRRLLGDSREPPRFIETLWGQGYRFIESVTVSGVGRPEPSGTIAAGSDQGVQVHSHDGARTRLAAWALAAMLLLLAFAGALFWYSSNRKTEPSVERLAVLPMTVESDADRWLAQALTDHLNQTISRIEGVTVIALGSTARYSSRSDPREVGRQLGVGAVLASQFYREGEMAGLRAQVLSTHDGSVLWSFAAKPSAMELGPGQIEQLATAVARRLWANLQLRGRPATVDPEAYRHFLRGRYFWNQRSNTGLAAAIEAYQAALAIEPDYVEALVGLADSWLLVPLYSATPPVEAAQRARAAAERALQLDSSTAAHALAVLGVIAMQHDWNWAEAEALLRQALTLDPNDASAEQWLAELYCYRLRADECRRHLQAAAGLDPLSPVLRMLRGSPALFSGDFAAAAAAYSHALEDEPEFPLTRYVLGLSYAGLGEWDRAIASYRASLPHLGLAIVGGPLVYALARSGDIPGARELLEELERLAETRYVPPTKLAVAWLGLGERARALEWLGQALDVRDDRLVYLAVDGHFFELHGDSEFRAYAEQVGVLDILQPR